MSSSSIAKNLEDNISFSQTKPLIEEGSWTLSQQRLLTVLQHEEHRHASIAKICRLAGYSGNTSWYNAMKDERFVAVIRTLGVKRAHNDLPRWQQQLLEVVQQEKNRQKPTLEICQLAGYKTTRNWRKAVKDERFVAQLEAIGMATRRHLFPSHLEVELATDLEMELAEDSWDLRRLKRDYPKHVSPTAYKIDFSWIVNPVLREQVKRYFQLRLTRWEAGTFRGAMYHLRLVLKRLPANIHVGTLQRCHIEALLPAISSQLSLMQQCRGLRVTKAMFEYMANSPAWTGPRPPRFLIWEEDIPSRPATFPRPVPPDVLEQFDLLLELAEKTVREGQEPSIFAPIFWDALLILRHTGMRFEDLAHLKSPDEHGRNGCLDQDPDGYWWVRIDHTNTKMKREHRIPTRVSDGVIDAIRRQQARVKHFPNHFDAYYLFRTEQGVLSRGQIHLALKKLIPHLTHEGQPYLITAHQFRHSTVNPFELRIA